MLLDVTIKQKGQTTVIKNDECTVFDMELWCRKGAALSKKLGVEILVKFQSRSHTFTFSPDEPDEVAEKYLQRNDVNGSANILKKDRIIDPALGAQFEGS